MAQNVERDYYHPAHEWTHIEERKFPAAGDFAASTCPCGMRLVRHLAQVAVVRMVDGKKATVHETRTLRITPTLGFDLTHCELTGRRSFPVAA